MKIHFVILAAAVVLAVGGGTASADILSIYAAAQGGGAGGKGMVGDQKDAAFHDGASGGAYGALVGVEFMLLDGWVEHTQYRGRGGDTRTWTQFMVGFDGNMDLGPATQGAHKNDKGKLKGGYAKSYLELGMAVGVGLGTGEQVDPPLDATEITDRGFLVQVSGAIGFRLNRTISLGVRVPVQYGYMFKRGVANEDSNQYQSVQGAALVQLRLDFQLK